MPTVEEHIKDCLNMKERHKLYHVHLYNDNRFKEKVEKIVMRFDSSEHTKTIVDTIKGTELLLSQN